MLKSDEMGGSTTVWRFETGIAPAGLVPERKASASPDCEGTPASDHCIVLGGYSWRVGWLEYGVVRSIVLAVAYAL